MLHHSSRCSPGQFRGICEAPAARCPHLYSARSSRSSCSTTRALRTSKETSRPAQVPQATDTPAITREGDPGTVEMFVASDEDLFVGRSGSSSSSSSSDGATPPAKKSKSVRVKPPRVSAPQRLKVNSLTKEAASSELTRQVIGDASKVLHAELGMTTAELRSKSSELQSSQQLVRTKDRELSLLRAAVADRDIRLRNAKTDLVSSRVAFQEKEAELQAAYHQLMTSAKERGDIRQQLLDTEGELAATRSELEAWTQQASTSNSSQQGSKEPAASSPVSKPEQVQDVTRLLSELHSLSRRIADDALEDELLFRDSDLS